MGDFRFPREHRLLTPRQFGRVFQETAFRVPHQQLLLLGVPNGLEHPRVGLVLAKKNLRLAAQRNRVRRLIRESFRHHRHQLPPVDIVLLARRGLEQQENAQILKTLRNLWQRLDRTAARHPGTVAGPGQS